MASLSMASNYSMKNSRLKAVYRCDSTADEAELSFRALEDRSCLPVQTKISWGHQNTFAISNRLEQSHCHLWW